MGHDENVVFPGLTWFKDVDVVGDGSVLVLVLDQKRFYRIVSFRIVS